ncbi:hypothetical protein SUGI_0666600 [Cryptomeria japonica]|nr:hypothetical protein SUGI_0666600 [Cryptomeria japonica]
MTRPLPQHKLDQSFSEAHLQALQSSSIHTRSYSIPPFPLEIKEFIHDVHTCSVQQQTLIFGLFRQQIINLKNLETQTRTIRTCEDDFTEKKENTIALLHTGKDLQIEYGRTDGRTQLLLQRLKWKVAVGIGSNSTQT